MNKDYIKEYFKRNELGGGQITNIPWIFKRLNLYIENSDWHDMESVYDHTNRVLSKFESFYSNEGRGLLTKEETMVDSFGKIISRAIIWHDVGKIEPKTVGDKIKYPGHELKSSEIFYEQVGLDENGITYLGSKERDDQRRFFSPEDEFIYEFIKCHGKVHEIITGENSFSELESLAKSMPHVEEGCYTRQYAYFDWKLCENPLNPKGFMTAFLHFGLAETMSSNLINTRPIEYAHRLTHYANALDITAHGGMTKNTITDKYQSSLEEYQESIHNEHDAMTQLSGDTMGGRK